MKLIWIVALLAATAGWGEETKWTARVGGGPNLPVGRTADFAHLSGAFEAGLGYRITERQTLLVEYLAAPLPLNSVPRQELKLLDPVSNFYSVSLNYRYALRTSGLWRPYLIGGAGWYRRSSSISRTLVGTEIACNNSLLWLLQFECASGFVSTETVIASATTNNFGYSAGSGVEIAPRRWKPRIFVEVRYHSAGRQGVPTTVVPLIVGLTW